jgi:metal-responsive CopG/Arc/MetJ family transcriptional regulator
MRHVRRSGKKDRVPGPKLEKDPKRVTTVRLPESLCVELKALSDERGMSVSAIITDCVRWGIDEYRKNHPKK